MGKEKSQTNRQPKAKEGLELLKSRRELDWVSRARACRERAERAERGRRESKPLPFPPYMVSPCPSRDRPEVLVGPGEETSRGEEEGPHVNHLTVKQTGKHFYSSFSTVQECRLRSHRKIKIKFQNESLEPKTSIENIVAMKRRQ